MKRCVSFAARNMEVRKKFATGLSLLAYVLILITGCSGDSSGGIDSGDTSDGDGGPNGTDSLPISGTDVDSDTMPYLDSDGETSDDDCEPEVIDCTDRCAKIRDKCSGEIYDCGGCEDGLVCDVVKNECVPPLVDCAAFGAECGAIRNSCGVRLDCGYCPGDQECNPDTNMCTGCTSPTCQDLGLECGAAWNGCGSPSSPESTIQCSDCTGGKICNSYYNLCEPDCVPDETEVVCDLAEMEKGTECGWISDGCGGIVNCGDDCPEGESCGVLGVANRCDKPERPLECVVLGWECGTLDSACSGKQDCGSCEDGDVCNSNHRCGPPCEPVACGEAYPGQCGQQLDDGCEGAIDCACGEDLDCDATKPGELGKCEPLNSCSDFTTGEDGQLCSNGASSSFPRGNEQDLTCPCEGDRICIDDGGSVVSGDQTGTCCTNTGSCQGNQCTATNSCTNDVANCCNNGTEWCNTSTNECVARLTCAEIYYDNPGPPPPNDAVADGTVGAPCSNNDNPLFDDGSGTLLACPCDPGLICVGGDGGEPGYCCENTNTCDNTALDDDCRVPNSCAGGPDIACCAWNECCVSQSCQPALTCDDITSGEQNDVCSRNWHFDACPPEATNQRTLRCRCDSDLCCSQPDSGEDGTCVPDPVCDGTCSVYDACRDRDIDCCESDQHCDTAMDACEDDLTCTDYAPGGLVPDGDLGDPCSDPHNTNWPVLDGTYLSCPCDTPPGYANARCVGDSQTQIGTCECAPTTCHCGNTGQSDGCGGILNCPCPPDAPECDTSQSPPVCCTPYACPTGGGGECDIVHASCGENITCGCPAADESCGGGGVPNQCGCTPETCRGRTGIFPDGCGGEITCLG